MQHCESINLDEYRQSGEGGTAITYKHNSRNSLAKLYKSGFEADMAIEEFKVAQAVYDLGIPTPKPYRLVTDGERLGAEYEFISGKRSFARILSQEPSTCVHGDFHIGNIITDGNRTLWIDIGQFGYGAPEWDLDAFLPAYLGTSAPTALREYTRKILAYYAVRVPFMFNLVHHDKFPEEGCKSLIGLIP